MKKHKGKHKYMMLRVKGYEKVDIVGRNLFFAGSLLLYVYKCMFSFSKRKNHHYNCLVSFWIVSIKLKFLIDVAVKSTIQSFNSISKTKKNISSRKMRVTIDNDVDIGDDSNEFESIILNAEAMSSFRDRLFWYIPPLDVET